MDYKAFLVGACVAELFNYGFSLASRDATIHNRIAVLEEIQGQCSTDDECENIESAIEELKGL